MARPSWLADEAPDAGSEAAQQLGELAAEVEALADAFVERLQALAQASKGAVWLAWLKPAASGSGAGRGLAVCTSSSMHQPSAGPPPPSCLQARRGVAEVLHRAGAKPQGASPEALSFWVVSGGRRFGGLWGPAAGSCSARCSGLHRRRV